MTKLTWHSGITDILTIILILICHILPAFIFVFTLVDFGYCPEHIINDWVVIRNMFVFLIIALTAEIWLLSKIWKSKTIIFACACWLIPGLLVFPLYITASETINYSSYYQEFEASLWLKTKEKPFRMIRTIYYDALFIGEKKKDVISQLGEGKVAQINYQDYIIYDIDKVYGQFILVFEKDVLVEYKFDCYD